MPNIQIDEVDIMRTYFTSKAAMFCFALNHTDTELRANMLKIDRSLYHDIDLAKYWYITIYNELASKDSNILECERTKALGKLVFIYRRMCEQ